MADNLKPGSSGTTVQGGRKPDGSGRARTLDEIRADRATRIDAGKPMKKKESWVRSLIVAAVIAIIIRSFFLEAFRIPTGSMKNTLLVGDYLFVNKLSYFFGSPRYLPFTNIQIPYFRLKLGSIDRGDIIVFEFPGDRDRVVPIEKNVNYIKRCIGLPGDSVMVRDKQVYVNGKIFPNPPESILTSDTMKTGVVDPGVWPRGAQWNRDNFGPIRVPKKGDTLWVNRDNFDQWDVFIEREGHTAQLGDNGMINVDGKATQYYLVERDYLWMMGDNRDNSLDSRFWGPAPVENVVGSAMVIYWSWYRPTDPRDESYDPDEVQKFHIRWGRIGRLIH